MEVVILSLADGTTRTRRRGRVGRVFSPVSVQSIAFMREVDKSSFNWV